MMRIMSGTWRVWTGSIRSCTCWIGCLRRLVDIYSPSCSAEGQLSLPLFHRTSLQETALDPRKDTTPKTISQRNGAASTQGRIQMDLTHFGAKPHHFFFSKSLCGLYHQVP